MPTLTPEQKRVLYKNGHYVFRPPPVPSANWDTDAWIRFIDSGHGWRPWLVLIRHKNGDTRHYKFETEELADAKVADLLTLHGASCPVHKEFLA